MPDPNLPAPITPRRRRSVVLLHLAVFGAFVLLGVVAWWRVWITGHPTSTFTCQCGDPSQELWFLAWTPWAIAHGHSPFLSNAIFAGRGGANMMVNTSWMAPSLVLAPITWLFGPIASFNVAATVAPAISGWCCFSAARKVTTFVPAQVLAGLLFGFSPFVLQNDPFGHLDFTLLFFPPLAFILLFDLFVERRRSPARTGVLLAVLVVVEFFTSTEFLAMCTLVIVVAVVAAALIAPRAAWSQRRRAATASGVAAGIAAVFLAYPVWFVLGGPRHIVGFPWANAPELGTTPSAIVNAGPDLHASSLFDQVGGYFGGVGPNSGPLHLPSGVFLGSLLVGFLLVSAVTWYRSRLAWTVMVATVVAWLFSFGTTLGTEAGPLSSRVHPGWLPWRAFSHLPLVSDILPIRFGALVMFGAAMVLALSLDRWQAVAEHALRRRSAAASPTQPRRHGRPLSGTVAGAVVGLAGVALLVPVALTNSVPFVVASTPLPAWFAAEAPRLAPGTVVLVVPFAGQTAMGWQAQAGMGFSLAGGFAVVPGADGRSAFVEPPKGAVAVLDRLSADPRMLTATPLPASPRDVAAVRSALLRWKVGVVVVTRQGARPGYSVGFLTAVFARAPSYRDGAWVWNGPPGPSRLRVGATTLAGCTGPAISTAPAAPAAPNGVPLAIPDCMLRAAARPGSHP
ncbi:MAG: serine/threonine-protein kinase [Acidimicrobiales bacterium]